MTDHARKIRLYGRMIKATCLVLGAMVAGAMIYAAMLAIADRPGLEAALTSYLAASGVTVSLNPGAFIGLTLIALANAAIMAGGLHALWRLADSFIAVDLFAASIGVRLRRIGLFALAGAISSIVSRTLAIAISTYGPDGHRQLAIAFSTNEAFLLLAAFLFLVLGQVMSLAAEMDRENKAFI